MKSQEEIENILGTIKCLEVKEQEDGSALLIFDVDESFKQNYMKVYNLSEWSLDHFEKTLSEAIEKRVEEVKNSKGE